MVGLNLGAVDNLWFIAAAWMGLALLASLFSIRLGLSVALAEILVGILAGNFLGLKTTPWIDFLATFGSGLLTFLAGAEIDPDSLRRLGRIEPLPRLVVAPRPPLPGRKRATLDVEVTPEQRAALDAALQAALETAPAPDGRPRRVHAAAIAPSVSARTGPRVVAVTQSHVAVVPLPGEGAPATYPLARVTSAELRHSPLGYHLVWTVGGANPLAGLSPGNQRRGAAGRPQRVALAFSMPAYPRFFALFAALRQALAVLPHCAASPELPAPAEWDGTAEEATAGAAHPGWAA